jgi:hypothetical protein
MSGCCRVYSHTTCVWGVRARCACRPSPKPDCLHECAIYDNHHTPEECATRAGTRVSHYKHAINCLIYSAHLCMLLCANKPFSYRSRVCALVRAGRHQQRGEAHQCVRASIKLTSIFIPTRSPARPRQRSRVLQTTQCAQCVVVVFTVRVGVQAL